MPKLLKNMQQEILRVAKEQLLSDGYAGFTIRSVASSCHIAIGTVYNYYPSKEYLAAAIMLIDWQTMLADMHQQVSQSETISAGLRVIYDGILRFQQKYQTIWSEYSRTSNSQPLYQDKHQLLIQQLQTVLHELFVRYQKAQDSYTEQFIAESIMMAARQEHPFDQYAELILRILI